ACTPAIAQDRLQDAPTDLSLLATHDPVSDTCRRVENIDLMNLVPMSPPRTFHDDFDEHPLKHDRWLPYYSGGAAWPLAQYFGGPRSQLKRQTKYNGEQQIYVDPHYRGLALRGLG